MTILSIEHNFNAMGGPCRLRLEVTDERIGREAIAGAEAEVQRLEQKYSRYTNDSLTSRINQAAGSGQAVTIDNETACLLQYADTAWRASDGRFDLTSGVLRRCWDFRSSCLPSQRRVAETLQLVGWQHVIWDSTSITLPLAGMEIDFGGCVKEYAVDRLAALLESFDIRASMIDLAGDLAVRGIPQSGYWPVGIRHPEHRGRPLAGIHMMGGALASSGDYERCMLVNGVRYGHILHPCTGWPVQDAPVAVSVLAPQCLVAGSSSTIAMLMPAEESRQWLQSLGLPWLLVDAELNCCGTLAQKRE